MEAVVYLLLGLAVVGALVYALMQVNARQQRLHAELTRLERLAAEVAMNAEAVLEQVDQRIERLNRLAAAVEAKAQSAQPEEVPQPAPTQEKAKAKKRAPKAASKAEAAKTAAAQAPAEEPPVQAEPPAAESAPPPAPKTPAERYSGLRQSVFALADQGKSVLEIAEALSIPRGEVQLMLNLRGRKVSPS
ncbi:MAG: DUF6115 domain-containing protein [Bacillota bacterium]